MCQRFALMSGLLAILMVLALQLGSGASGAYTASAFVVVLAVAVCMVIVVSQDVGMADAGDIGGLLVLILISTAMAVISWLPYCGWTLVLTYLGSTLLVSIYWDVILDKSQDWQAVVIALVGAATVLFPIGAYTNGGFGESLGVLIALEVLLLVSSVGMDYYLYKTKGWSYR